MNRAGMSRSLTEILTLWQMNTRDMIPGRLCMWILKGKVQETSMILSPFIWSNMALGILQPL